MTAADVAVDRSLEVISRGRRLIHRGVEHVDLGQERAASERHLDGATTFWTVNPRTVTTCVVTSTIHGCT
jgi:hypothetical protein